MIDALTIDRTSRRVHVYRYYRLLASPFLLALALTLIIGTVIAIGLWLFSPSFIVPLVPIALILFGSAQVLLLLFTFATTYLADLPPLNANSTLFNRLSFSLIRILLRRRADPAELYAKLLSNSAARQLVQRLSLTTDNLHIATGNFQSAIVRSQLADTLGQIVPSSERIYPEDYVAALLLQPSFTGWLRQHDLQEDDVLFVHRWMRSVRLNRQRQAAWWQADQLLDFSGIGLSWAAGYTPLVDQFSRLPVGNLWDRFSSGREQYTEQLITTLARLRQSNVLLVGQPGVGRLGIVKDMAQRVRAQQAHPALNGQRVVYLHVGELLSFGSTSAGQMAIISNALAEMEHAGNIIAVIDGISSILSDDSQSELDLTEVLLPFFSSLSVRVVVIISSEEYHLRLKTNDEIIHFFEIIQVPSASRAETLQKLALATPVLEREGGAFLPYQTLRQAVDGTSGIMQHIPYPERAFDILEEAIVQAQSKRQTIILPQNIDDLITQKVGVPIGQLRRRESEYLLDLENIMHRRLVNQHHAVSSVARAMIRARAGVRNTERPIGTFLFLGPTGVGKTETAKTLSETYFGSEEYMTRLDMSEYQSKEGLATLIGSRHNPVGRLTSLITDKPFTVLLLDEFEKAHASIQQLFLQVLDEGRITDVRGHTASFQHTIIIATSNAGAELIRQATRQGSLPPDFDQTLQEYVLSQNIFRPELYNRFDGVITFSPLSTDHIRQIAGLMLKKLNGRLDAQHGITVEITDELLDYLVEIGYDPQFGARPMNRAIQDTVEYVVARMILSGTVQPGQQISLPIKLLQAEVRSKR